jgi:PKD repeat protein
MNAIRCAVRLAAAVVLLGPLGASAAMWQAPVADFTVAPERPSVNDVVVFDAADSAGAGGIARYEWDFDGDGVPDASTDGPQVRRFFPHSGTFQVTLQVVDAGGGRASATRALEVLPAPVSVRRELDLTLEPNRVLAGGSFFVEVHVEVRERVSGLGLSEVLPAGWHARSLEVDGAIFKRAGDELQWLWTQQYFPGERVAVRYEVSVPETAPRGAYALTGTISSYSPNKFKLAVSGLWDVQVL